MPKRKKSSRFDRQERLNLWDQNLIETSSVLISGAGGTGSEVAKNLSLTGFGKIILIDQDTVEISNLNRQLLYNEKVVGKFKAETAIKTIKKRYNPEIDLKYYNKTIQEIPTSVFEDVDVIAGCVDNWRARQYINSVAMEINKPLIDSGTEGFFGQVQTVIRGKSACLACDDPEPPDETIVLSAPCSLVGDPRERNHCIWKALYQFSNVEDRSPDENSSDDINKILKIANNIAIKNEYSKFEEREIKNLIAFHIPALATVNSIISGIQSQEIIKCLFLKKKALLNSRMKSKLNGLIRTKRFRIPNLTIYSALTGTLNTFDLTPDKNCLVCSKKSLAKMRARKLTVNSSKTIDHIMSKLKLAKDDHIIFYRNQVLSNEDIIKNVISSGDRIIVTSLINNKEKRVIVNYK